MLKKINKNKILLVITSIFLIANTTFALTFSELTKNVVNDILVNVSKFAFVFAAAFFFWGGFKFVVNSNNSADREQGKNWMFFSVIAIFVMVSVWGLVKIAENTFDLDNNTKLEIKMKH